MGSMAITPRSSSTPVIASFGALIRLDSAHSSKGADGGAAEPVAAALWSASCAAGGGQRWCAGMCQGAPRIAAADAGEHEARARKRHPSDGDITNRRRIGELARAGRSDAHATEKSG